MSVTRKQSKFLDEYLIDFNATQAAIRAGYSEKTAYSIASALLKKVEIKEELSRRMAEGRMTTEEIVSRIEAMVTGEIPTKEIRQRIKAKGRMFEFEERVEYDTKGALQDLGKVYALFVDKQIVENIGLEIVDDEQESPPEDPPASP